MTKQALYFLFLLLGIGLQAQTARKYSNEFLNIGVNAAAFGMANAVTATTNDVYAGYWNPAGLTRIEDHEIALMHANYFANIANYDYLGSALKIDDESSLGIHVLRFGVDNILNTTQLIDDQGQIDYDRISLFSAADYAFTFSYAKNLPLEGFSFGVNAKVIHRIIGEFANSWGFGLDAGIQFQGKNGWEFGAMARDITTTYNTWSIDEDAYSQVQDAVEGQNQELPETTEITLPKLQLGVAKNFRIRYDWDIKAALDLQMRFAQTQDLIATEAVSVSPALGFQVGYLNLVYLRGGVGNFQNVEQLEGGSKVGFQPGFGLGFKYKGIHIDYAFTDIGDQSVALYSNVFSLKIDWRVFR
ncbi:PorV/PorQ family protein [Mesonia sp. HuA40]|uniref:putative type IX sorting system protein PorV2 n=1 Tax=Mesonia sp. HuA40 TaxID=2602761 RepID=UPI0011CA450D|nr:PorV/PorQ family protein [Mesonia sp. HuA40]TXK70190.1 PorV/PorQ family protein [Mesonia sp. HuA40]